MTNQIDKPGYRISIGPEQAGRMIKNILLSDLRMSRRLVRHLAQTQNVFRNHESVFLTQRAHLGDEIYVMLPNEDSSVAPEPMKLDIRYEDTEFLVVNKPPGVLTHPTAREKTGSLLAGIRAHLGVHMVPHCVHRLDRDTSGLVIFAKHAHAHQLLDLAMRAGQVHRVYNALATGFGPSSQENLAGALDGMSLHEETRAGAWHSIDLPIAQDPDKPSRRLIDESGQRAVTQYRLVEVANGIGLLQIVLETGRTHQIRLHLASIGHPLLGERDYTAIPVVQGTCRDTGDNKTSDIRTNSGCRESLGPEMVRQALHAAQIGWRHPVTGVFQLVTAEPPQDIKDAWTKHQGSPDIWTKLVRDQSGLQRVELLS